MSKSVGGDDARQVLPKYPRVLIVTKVRVSERDNVGASVGKWFADWPSEKLAQLYFGGAENLPTVGSYEYRLGQDERRFGNLLGRLKRSRLGVASRPVVRSAEYVAPTSRSPFPSVELLSISRALERTGLWEFVFAPQLSEKLMSWVRAFKPDIVFALASDMTLTRLTLALGDRLCIPMCVHVSDDFPGRSYRDSGVGSFARWAMASYFRRLVARAVVRYANLPAMAAAYRQRYGVAFDTLMMCDTKQRFAAATPVRRYARDTASLVYVGSLAHDRWRSLLDVGTALEQLGQSGLLARLDIYTSYIEPEAERALSANPRISVHPAVADAEVPSILRGADILVLAEGFSDRSLRDVQLSLSSKAHLYMASERPTLVYGRAGGGVVEYAKAEGWASVVDNCSTAELMSAIESLLHDEALRLRLSMRASETFAANHDASAVREQVRVDLRDAWLRST